MTSSDERRWLGGLLAVLAAFVLFAATAVEKAAATEVLPSQQNAVSTVNATLKPNEFSWFIPNNAYFPGAVGCETASASFDVQPNNDPGDNPAGWSLNRNQPRVGIFSEDHGGVISNLDEPVFDDCAVYNVTGRWAQQWKRDDPPPVVLEDVFVTTESGWTVSAFNNGVDGPLASIAVPPEGATIEIQIPSVGSCFLDVTQGKAQSVFAEFVNADPEADPPTDAELLVDSQIKFVAQSGSATLCAALGFDLSSPARDDAIAQYEADYDVTSADGPVQILP